MRITADILSRADHYLNAVNEREINLRGLKIPVIENLSILQDQFDCIDLTDNELKVLDNFPNMSRLSTLLLHNNNITRIGSIGSHLPNLSTLLLTNNKIASLADVDALSNCSKLTLLLPSLKCLDYIKIKKSEREAATVFFSSNEGKQVLQGVQSTATSRAAVPAVLSDAQRAEIRAAIEAATTKEEMDRIEKQLKTGTFVFKNSGNGNAHSEDDSNRMEVQAA